MKKRLFFFGVILICGLSVYSQTKSNDHLQAIARPGEKVNSLLALYDLDSPCNTKYFCLINAVKEEDVLVANKSYFLPCYVYKYNGKSIRTTLGIEDFQRAVRIQHYNESMFKAKLHIDDFRRTKVLWVPHSELTCPDEAKALEEERLGPAGTYDIFGKKYAKVKPVSTKLKGRVFYVVAGHGGPDPGAVGTRAGIQLCEDEYAYDVALRLARRLLEHGATAYVIIRDNDGIRDEKYLKCDEDETCWKDEKIPRSQKLRLAQRSDAINELYETNKKAGVKDQTVIAIHVDSEHKNERVDTYFYYYPGMKRAQQLCNTLKETFKAKYDQYQKGRGYEGSVKSRDLHMLREPIPTSVFVELGNIKNTNDQKRIIIPSNRQAIADWLSEGFLKAAK